MTLEKSNKPYGGRYDQTKACIKCGATWIRKDTSKDGSINNRCITCNYEWAIQGLDSYPVEPVGSLYKKFIEEQASFLLEKNVEPIQVLKFSMSISILDITGTGYA